MTFMNITNIKFNTLNYVNIDIFHFGEYFLTGIFT